MPAPASLTANRIVLISYKENSDDWVGSGLLFGASQNAVGKILTADHIAIGTEITIKIENREFPATVLVRSGSTDVDLAVLEVHGLPPIETMDIALLRRDVQVTLSGCTAVGFPEFKVGNESQRRAAHVLGDITNFDGLQETVFDGLTIGFMSFKVTSVPSGELTEKPWSGMSGAAILNRDEQVIGVVRHHSAPEGGGSLGFTPLSAIKELSPNLQELFWQALGVKNPVLVPELPERMSYKSPLGQEHRGAAYRNKNRGREPYVALELNAKIDAYLVSDWREEQRSNVWDLVQYSGSIDGTDRILRHFELVPWNSSYEKIVDYLSNLPFKELESIFGIKLHNCRDKLSRKKMHKAISIVRQLESQAKFPRYGTVFAVMGTWGAGKSRLLHEVESRLSENSSGLVLNLEPYPGRPLEQQIVSESGDLLNRTFLNIADLVKHLETRVRERLVITIDDIHIAAKTDSNFLLSFERLVAKWTIYSSIKWIVTADTALYDSLVRRHQGKFWTEYLFASKDIDNIGNADVRRTGWIDLDGMNLQDRVGLGILKTVDDSQLNAQLSEIERNSELFDHGLRLLCNPLPAWLCLEQDDKGERRLDVGLNHVNFVKAYWNSCLADLSGGPADEDAIKQAFGILVRRVSDSPLKVEVSEDKLISRIRDDSKLWELKDRQSIRRYLGLLESVGLLVRKKLGEDEDGISESRLHPGIAPVWAYRIADRIAISDSSATQEKLGKSILKWGQLTAQDNWLAESVCEFYLEMIPWQGNANIKARDVWSDWATRLNFGRSALLLAAIWAPLEAQITIADLLESHQLKLKSKREIFALLRLVGLAQTVHWRCHARLNALGAHFSTIGIEGLGDYFSFTAARVISTPELMSKGEYLTVLMSLKNVDRVGDARAIVGSLVDAGARLFDGSEVEWLKTLLKYFSECTVPEPSFQTIRRSGRKSVPTRNSSIRRGGSAETRIAGPLPGPSDFIGQLGRAVILRIVEVYELSALDMLLSAGWYGAEKRWGLNPHHSLQLQTDANIALGKLFNPFGGSRTSAYISVVRSLVAGRKPGSSGGKAYSIGQQRVIAFFLIRHSRPTHGDRGVVVNSRLLPMLRTAANDPEVQRAAGKWLAKTAQANGIVIRWRINDLNESARGGFGRNRNDRGWDTDHNRGSFRGNKRGR